MSARPKPVSAADRARRRYERMVAAGRAPVPAPAQDTEASAAEPQQEAREEDQGGESGAERFAGFMGCAP
ncbi:hypothetical protein [Parvularcula oceani]|uniref:hypothetical protein n=1 Tax=Parvularcula oceani TaxID=1247963 RepID=UPI0004E19D0F|nr:hypothetical protein [Parvularcula oceani]